METFFTVPLNCNICGNQTGSHVVSSKYGFTANTSATDLGFVDVRCDSCITTNGAFTDMVQKAKLTLKLSATEAELFATTHRTKTSFDTAVTNAIKNKVQLQ